MWRTVLVFFANGPKSGDFADKLNYRFTLLLFVFCSALLAVDQWIEDPIRCFSPPKFTASMAKFSEAHCYLSTRFYDGSPRTDPPGQMTEREQLRQPVYYHWMPLQLLLRAICFYVPWICWQFVGANLGAKVLSLIDIAESTQNEDHELIRQMAGRFGERQSMQAQLGERAERKQAKPLDKLLQILSIVVGSLTPLFYLILKLLFLYNLNEQLHQLTADLGQSDVGIAYSRSVVNNVTAGLPYQRNYTQLPMTVLCDWEMLVIGNIQRYSSQCLLPIYTLVERVLIGLSLWLQLVSLATLFSFLYWLFVTVVLPVNVLLVRGYLKGAKPYSIGLATLFKFTYGFLTPGGVFLLRLLNAKDAQRLMGPLWDRFERDQQRGTYAAEPMGYDSGNEQDEARQKLQ